MSKNSKTSYNRSDIEKELRTEFPSLTKNQISLAIDAILQTIIESVALDKKVEIRGFGTFSKKNIRPWLDVKDYVKDKAVDMLNEGATIIVPVKVNIVSKLICGPNNSLGIRISNHPFCESLTSLYPNPITTTSVNFTKNPPMTTPLKIYEKFSNGVDLIIEDGIIKGKGSTIKVYKSNNTWEKIR